MKCLNKRNRQTFGRVYEEKAFKAFIKPFEAPQKSVKIKL